MSPRVREPASPARARGPRSPRSGWPLLGARGGRRARAAARGGRGAGRRAVGARSPRCPRAADLQAALDRAAPGDVIALEAGATYTGPFTLPRKTGEGFIVVRTGAPEAELPPAGHTASAPSHARLMPKLVSASGPVIAAAPGAHHYRFVGVEIAPAGRRLPDEPGRARRRRHVARRACRTTSSSSAATCTAIRVRGARRGIALNSRHVRVVDSLLRRLQGGRRRLAGHRGLERAGALRDREQLSRGGGRERDVRRRRPDDRGSRPLRHRDPAEPPGQAARVEGRRARRTRARRGR